MRASEVRAGVLALWLCGVAQAQTVSSSTASANGASAAVRMPSASEMARQPAVVMPRIDTPELPLQRGIDAGALAAQYEAMRNAATADTERSIAGLMVFVTLQMPRPSLQRLVEQAERSRATLVLRGLKNRSMKGTLAEVADLIGNRKVAWMIDPQSFKRYGVVLAPTFVLVAPQDGAAAGCAASHCVAEPAFSSVAGDVSISYALQTMERGDPALKRQALAYLSRLEARR